MAKKITNESILPTKMLVSVDELSEITGIGVNRLREQILVQKDIEDAVVLRVGTHIRIKVDAFRQLINQRKYL